MKKENCLKTLFPCIMDEDVVSEFLLKLISEEHRNYKTTMSWLTTLEKYHDFLKEGNFIPAESSFLQIRTITKTLLFPARHAHVQLEKGRKQREAVEIDNFNLSPHHKFVYGGEIEKILSAGVNTDWNSLPLKKKQAGFGQISSILMNVLGMFNSNRQSEFDILVDDVTGGLKIYAKRKKDAEYVVIGGNLSHKNSYIANKANVYRLVWPVEKISVLEDYLQVLQDYKHSLGNPEEIRNSFFISPSGKILNTVAYGRMAAKARKFFNIEGKTRMWRKAIESCAAASKEATLLSPAGAHSNYVQESVTKGMNHKEAVTKSTYRLNLSASQTTAANFVKSIIQSQSKSRKHMLATTVYPIPKQLRAIESDEESISSAAGFNSGTGNMNTNAQSDVKPCYSVTRLMFFDASPLVREN